MASKEVSIKEKLETIIKDLAKEGGEGCCNCQFCIYKDGERNYCEEHDEHVDPNDEACKDYLEQGTF